jgi:hypothetical protein
MRSCRAETNVCTSFYIHFGLENAAFADDNVVIDANAVFVIERTVYIMHCARVFATDFVFVL